MAEFTLPPNSKITEGKHYQSKDVGEIINFIRANSPLRSLDEKEIERLMHVVCTPYKDSPDSVFIVKNA